MPLIIAPENRELKIVKVVASDKVKKHLENLGININSVITVLSHNGGTVICKVKEGRLALDHATASTIQVA